MKNFCFTLQYDGTRYNGWQRAGNTSNTIQGKVEGVLSQMMEHAVEVHGAGRTDAGVHAKGQVMHTKLNTKMTAKEVQAYLNRYLPQDIAVVSAKEMDDRFHARLQATGKRYVYRVWTSDVPNVFSRKYMYTVTEPLDLEKMQQAAVLLSGTHDYRAFCGNSRMKKGTTRTVDSIEITHKGGELRFVFTGNGFLQYMVRILMGTLLEVGTGKRKVLDVQNLFKADAVRADAGYTVPPHGLILDEVFYEK